MAIIIIIAAFLSSFINDMGIIMTMTIQIAACNMDFLNSELVKKLWAIQKNNSAPKIYTKKPELYPPEQSE